jgi:hypothetical protein
MRGRRPSRPAAPPLSVTEPYISLQRATSNLQLIFHSSIIPGFWSQSFLFINFAQLSIINYEQILRFQRCSVTCNMPTICSISYDPKSYGCCFRRGPSLSKSRDLDPPPPSRPFGGSGPRPSAAQGMGGPGGVLLGGRDPPPSRPIDLPGVLDPHPADEM